jgi:hypothetical protein
MSLGDLSDRDLIKYIRSLDRDIGAARAQIETAATRRKRTLRIVRATILTAGGFFAATFDVLGIALTCFGVWDWIEVIADDAEEMNRQIALHRAAEEYLRLLQEAEEELQRRLSHLP